MTTMPEIRFLIIGAPKAGTTSLFEYMRRHPDIHMPAEKEIYFFASDRAFGRGKDWYLRLVTKGAPDNAVCGEATPRYMAGVPTGDFSESGSAKAGDYGGLLEDVIPGRIKHHFPDVKLICVLRDPVARAYSHYRMSVSSRVESRSFPEAVEQLLTPSTLESTRIEHAEDDGYVVFGEYARVLAGFLRTFPREQLMVVFSDELANEPHETLGSVFEFVGVPTDFTPENLDKRYLAASSTERIRRLNLYIWKKNLSHSKPARALWRSLPAVVQREIGSAYMKAAYRINLWNARRTVSSEDIPLSTRLSLIRHFRGDSEELEALLDVEVPWLKEWDRLDHAQSALSPPVTL